MLKRVRLLRLRLKPKLVSALSILVFLLARTNRTRRRSRSLKKVLRIDPSHERRSSISALSMLRGRLQTCRTAAGKGCRPDSAPTPDSASPLIDTRECIRSRRSTQEASPVTLSGRGTAKDPRTLFTLALSLAEAHEYAEAVRLFQRTNELRPQTYEVLYNLGLALYNLDRLDEAQQALSSASALKPAEAEPYYRLGLIASAQSDTKQGFDALDQSARAAARLS